MEGDRRGSRGNEVPLSQKNRSSYTRNRNCTATIWVEVGKHATRVAVRCFVLNKKY